MPFECTFQALSFYHTHNSQTIPQQYFTTLLKSSGCTLVKKYTPSNAVSSHGKIGRWKREKGGHDLSQFVTRGHRQCRVVVGKKSDASDFCNCIGNGGRVKKLQEGMEVPCLNLPLEVTESKTGSLKLNRKCTSYLLTLL